MNIVNSKRRLAWPAVLGLGLTCVMAVASAAADDHPAANAQQK